MLKKIKITKLFDIFDYDIKLKPEGITILTGPNGYGKTTILMIIRSLASRNPLFLMNLLFEKITLEFENQDTITIKKIDKEEIEFQNGKHKLKRITKTLLNKLLKKELDRSPFSQIDDELWINERSDTIIKIEDLFEKVIPNLSKKGLFENFPSTPKVYLIPEQRLLRRDSENNSRAMRRRFPPRYAMNESFTKTIKKYAEELKETVTTTLEESSQIALRLDSSFPRRLFEEKNKISQKDFDIRFKNIKEIQKALSTYDLSIINEDDQPIYKEENAKALCVYLDDTEKKLEVFSTLLKKFKTFTDILNERCFINKKIEMSRKNGFRFITDQGQSLALTDLSSGEQHEVVLLYELLFKVAPGTLVLIDEPEISLHVVWQMAFLKDMKRIAKFQKFNVIIATHSPQIIDEHWDWTVDLKDISQ